MKNVVERQKKTCIFLLRRDLCDIIESHTEEDFELDVSCAGIFVTFSPGLNLCEFTWTEADLIPALSEHFDVNVTSIHVDQCEESPGIWVCYKER